MDDLRWRYSFRSGFSFLVLALTMVGAIVVDSVTFEHKDAAAALSSVSTWLYAVLVLFLIAVAVMPFRYPSVGSWNVSPPAKTLREWVAGALMFGLLLTGDVRISEWIVRSAFVYPWLVGGIMFTNVFLTRWKDSHSDELHELEIRLRMSRDARQAARRLS